MILLLLLLLLLVIVIIMTIIEITNDNRQGIARAQTGNIDEYNKATGGCIK